MRLKGLFSHIFVLVLSLNIAFAQKYFKLSGTLKNYPEKFISLTYYSNFVAQPQDYFVKVNATGNYKFELPLEEISYCDLNIGELGFLKLKIEGNDEIELNVDYKKSDSTLQILGNGSAKWLFAIEHRKMFETEKDWDFDLNRYTSKIITQNGYFALTKYFYDEQIKLLEKFKDLVSPDFYSLQRADIYGKVSNYELVFLSNNKLFNQKEFDRFQLKTFNAKTQDKSYDLGNFIEVLIEKRNELLKRKLDSRIMDYEFTKAYFDKSDYVSKTMIDRILAAKILNFIDEDGASVENKILGSNYEEFSKNKNYSDAIKIKLNSVENLKPGKKAFEFSLPNEKQKLVSLKDFKGKNVLLSFFASWCEACVADVKQIEVVHNYFKSKNDLAFVNISIDNPSDLADFLKENKIYGTVLNAFGNKETLQNYNIESVPFYLLIDKSGDILTDEIMPPADDEGRGLIKQLEDLLFKK